MVDLVAPPETAPPDPVTKEAASAHDLADLAARQASAAAKASGVTVRELDELDDLAAVYRLVEQIWRPDPANAPVTPEILRALVKGGNYVVGAFDGGRLLGACVGFFGPPSDACLHSHIAGVTVPGRRIGLALKLHQRAWALRRGIDTVTWTFDPLVRRNAHVNLVLLAARAAEYIRNFYGSVNDAINGTDDTDRLLAEWSLDSPAVCAAAARISGVGDSYDDSLDGGPVDPVVILAEGPDGGPVAHAAGPGAVFAAATPRDIEMLRRTDVPAAMAWRRALRDALTGVPGAVIDGFDDRGRYLLRATARPEGRVIPGTNAPTDVRTDDDG